MSNETAAPITFDDWVIAVFDHPVTEPAWHWNLDAEYLETSPVEDIAFLTRLFEECETVLNPYSDAQVAQGLDYLMGRGNLDYGFELRNTEIPLSDRLHCIESIATLFERCFAVRCFPYLCHSTTRGTSEGYNPLNGICCVWWDVLPLHGLVKHRPEHPDSAILDERIMSVIQRILKLDAVACQESAIFGLADWQIYYPEVQEIIDEFAASHRDLWEQFNPKMRETFFGVL